MSSIDKINVGGVDFDITSSPTPVMAPVETGTTATQAYAVGDYVIVGSTLHEVTAAIAIGGTFTEGTNISTSTSLGNEIKEVKDDVNQLNNDVSELNDDVSELNDDLTDLFDTNTLISGDGYYAFMKFGNIMILVGDNINTPIAGTDLSRIIPNNYAPSINVKAIACFRDNFSITYTASLDTSRKLKVYSGTTAIDANHMCFKIAWVVD